MQKYKTILADPPWPESGGGRIKRGADAHYPLMTVEAIKQLPVGQLVDPEGCHLYLWVTNNYLRAGFEVLDAWCFHYITIITWAKEGRIGLGQYYRGMTEHCLFARRGVLPYREYEGRRAQGTTLIQAPRGEHSAKPESLRRIIEIVSYPPRVELFARTVAPGWDVWGNQVSSTVKLEPAVGSETVLEEM